MCQECWGYSNKNGLKGKKKIPTPKELHFMVEELQKQNGKDTEIQYRVC